VDCRGVKRLIVYHYRRAGFDRDLREFQVVLERESVRVKRGEWLGLEGDFCTPKQVFELMDRGWKLIAVMSCFRWDWSAKRYIDEADRWVYSDVEEDVYGRLRANVLYVGYHEVYDVFVGGKHRRYRCKGWICLETSEGKVVVGHVPAEVRGLFLDVDWYDEKVVGRCACAESVR